MSVRYSVEHTLDLGDLGELDCTVEGTVHESGLLGPGRGFVRVELEAVSVLFPGQTKAQDVKNLLTKAARVSCEERLEQKYNYGYERFERGAG